MDELSRLSVVRVLSDVYEKLVDTELRLSAAEAALSDMQTAVVNLELRLAAPGRSRRRISRLLVSHFDVAEIDGLAFCFGVDGDQLRGETRAERARSLVSYCERHGVMPLLLSECRQQRPSVNWPSTPAGG